MSAVFQAMKIHSVGIQNIEYITLSIWLVKLIKWYKYVYGMLVVINVYTQMETILTVEMSK